MKYNKKSKLKLATAALLMGGLFNAQAFSLNDYFPKDDRYWASKLYRY
jgi:hypothetical protein